MVLDSEIPHVTREHPLYPSTLRDEPGGITFWAAGPLDILSQPAIGLVCSSQCPGAVILKTFDAITAMRDRREIVIGGFHSPMEWSCFEILLRGRQPVVWVPARSIQGMRLKPELRPAFAAGRLLILSPFAPKASRITTELAQQRNRFVAAIASRIFVPHAAPSSRTLALCEELAHRAKPVFTIEDPANARLLAILGVQPLPVLRLLI